MYTRRHNFTCIILTLVAGDELMVTMAVGIEVMVTVLVMTTDWMEEHIGPTHM